MSFYQQHRGGKFVKEIAALATYNGTSWHCSPCTWGARAEVLRSRAGVKVKTKLIAKLWKYKTSAPTIVMGNGFVFCICSELYIQLVLHVRPSWERDPSSVALPEVSSIFFCPFCLNVLLVRTVVHCTYCKAHWHSVILFDFIYLSAVYFACPTLGGVELLRFTTVRMDRDTKRNGKWKGGGLVLFINTRWCNPGNVTVWSHVQQGHCAAGDGSLTILHAQKVLPRHCCLFYISPQLHAKTAYDIIRATVTRLHTTPRCFYCQCCAWTRSVNDRSWTRSYFWANVIWTFCVLPDEHYCERVHSGIYEQRSRKVLLNSRECQISIEPSRQKLAKTHRKQALICSGKSPIWQHQPPQSCTTAKHGGKNKWRQQHYLRLCLRGGWKYQFINALQYIFSISFRQAASPDYPLSLTGRPSVPASSSWKHLTRDLARGSEGDVPRKYRRSCGGE